jgi:hypothetical protein
VLAIAFPKPASGRIASVAAVVLLHGLFVIVLLHVITSPKPVEKGVREILMHLTPPARPKPRVVQPTARSAKKQRTPQQTGGIEVPSSLPAWALPPAHDDRPALQSFGRALSNCTPESLGNLSAEERAACGRSGFALGQDDQYDLHQHATRSKDAPLWARRRDRKNAPALLPCANPNAPATAFLSIGTLICLTKGAIDGKFDMDAAPGYADKPEVIHLPNNGDPPDKPPG